LLKAKDLGFTIKLLFFWLPSIEMAINRVAIRVSEGGHNIPNDIIARRYKRGIENLFKIYLPLCDSFLILDNEEEPLVIAKGTINQKIEIMNEVKWNLINSTNE
jgi:predicted ABC-type ATPase